MYNPKSKVATEFIDDAEILETLDYAQKNKANRALIEQILEKAKECKGLSHKEAAVLLECEIPDLIEKIFTLAKEIKQRFYGNRIVMFAPLYLSNYCVNECRTVLITIQLSHCPQAADPGGDCPGGYGAAGHGPQAPGAGNRRGPGQLSH